MLFYLVAVGSVIATSTDGVDWIWDNTGTVNTLNLSNVYNAIISGNCCPTLFRI